MSKLETDEFIKTLRQRTEKYASSMNEIQLIDLIKSLTETIHDTYKELGVKTFNERR